MGMPLELNTMIVTKGKEQRLEENLFILEKDDYRLYPIEIPLDIRRSKESDTSGTAVIKKMEWKTEKRELFINLFL